MLPQHSLGHWQKCRWPTLSPIRFRVPVALLTNEFSTSRTPTWQTLSLALTYNSHAASSITPVTQLHTVVPAHWLPIVYRSQCRRHLIKGDNRGPEQRTWVTHPRSVKPSSI